MLGRKAEEWDSSSLQKRWLRGHVAAAPATYREGYRENRTTLYAAVCDGRTRDNVFQEEVQSGCKENLPPEGQAGSGAGCTERLRGLCPWTFSRPDWMKPWVMRSDLVADPALSTRLVWRPPEGPSNLNYPSDS